MAPDRPEETDVLVETRHRPPDSPARHPPAEDVRADRTPADRVHAESVPADHVRADHVRPETRDRDTYERELRAAVAADRWQSVITRFTDRWSEHQARWPATPADSQPEDPRTSEIRRQVGADARTELERGHDRIRDAERRVITPALREIDSQDSTRSLVGLDHRLKGSERLQEKLADYLLADAGASPSEALSRVPDAIRFTFCYSDERYVGGVRADIDRMESRGFELVRPLKNSWDADLYKGINSQWRDRDTGQRFEVQFHTHMSFEAKQATHAVYERLRNPATTDSERDELKSIQREVSAGVPVPADADRIRHGVWEDQRG